MIKIILCTYNGSVYIKELVESIKKQTCRDWKICVYDDRSTDDTVDILKTYQESEPDRFKITINEKGFGAKLNFLQAAAKEAVDMTESDYMMFCDQDDVWLPDKIECTLEKMVKIQKENADKPLLVCTDTRVVDKNLNTVAESFFAQLNYNMDNMDLSHHLMENKIQGCTVMINHVLAKKMTKIPKSSIMHDSWMGLIALSMGKVVYIPKATMLYRQHSDNECGAEDFSTMLKGKLGHLGEQKQIVFASIPQTLEFINFYKEELGPKELARLQAFATLDQQNWFQKRKNIIKYKMWKTGVIRNAGLMLLI